MDGMSRLFTQITVLLIFMCFQLEGWISLAAATKSSSGAIVESLSIPDDCQTVAAEGDLVSVRFTESRSSTEAEMNNVKETMVTLGDPGIIAGWNEALIGACEGEQRKLIIPATLAYSELPPSLQSNINITYVIYVVQIDKPVPDNPAVDNSINFGEDLFMTTMVVVTEETDSEDSKGDDDKEETVEKDKTQSGGGKTVADDNADGLSFIEVLQFVAIPVVVILIVLVIYYLYKLRHPHKKTTFYKDPC
ncbi:Peptidyl-prolyl cis-trans isomerase FKBP2 [Holothuria leucospilota]|uniref:peptidylprolyl isomerase n=1 Tax=Holothuria leucospilota TaxID=206669 RepID=A0A9Q1BBN4_HOLLE|nr:Peptidyl-prolyl cis-trans isomerase FKBP2 [Holothuria leucospilota]